MKSTNPWRKRSRPALVWLLMLLPFAPAGATEVWFSATEPVWRSIHHWPPDDWLDLFKQDAPWQHAASAVGVFELSKRAVLDMTSTDLAAVVLGLQQRHIRLAVQGTPLVASRACGLGIEGFGPPGDMAQVARRLSALHARLDFVTLDEPLWFGHVFDGMGRLRPCHLSIAEVARQTALKMNAVRRVFPHVMIGDDEPIGVPAEAASAWPEALQQWMRAYRAAMHEPLRFLHADVVWQRPTWRPLLKQIEDVARQQHVQFGVIYNGAPDDRSDAAWIAHAVEHFEMVEAEMHIPVDQAVFQSWMDFPRRMLPEAAPDAMTNLILRYQSWRSAR